jgi:hypothetical protein
MVNYYNDMPIVRDAKLLNERVIAAGISIEHHNQLSKLLDQAKNISNRMKNKELTDLDATEELLDSAAEMYGDDTNGALTDLGIVVGGLDTVSHFRPCTIRRNECNALFDYYIGYEAFVPDQTALANYLNPHDDNQVRHFFAGVAGANAPTRGPGMIFMYARERAEEDREMYLKSFEFFRFLTGKPHYQYGGHSLNDAGTWVRENLGP